MPHPCGALLDIATTYRQELERQGIPALPNADALGGYVAFQQIQTRAQLGIDALTSQPAPLSPETQGDLTRLYEIQDKATHILTIFQALQQRGLATWDQAYTRAQIASTPPAFPLAPEEFMLLSKFWELGLEEIAMQTFIQIDGDVITRIHPKYAGTMYELLHVLHQNGIRVSVTFWQELVHTIGAFARIVFARFF
ncbi:MAG: hypothetical protein FJZ47_21565 [Candidatus Tectomicrobia bacterium]|uniref:Uncharacterized protein n=1 Tax=Tectimicrobiota bacterium TaxID=2528274 RepID=A0A937W704_UNCTE|nr:hypothetical protein [Candidatus Tectomicrobia bacterium]